MAHQGDFEWKGQNLNIKGEVVSWDGKVYDVTWLSKKVFFHKQGDSDYWYYIWGGEKSYHCVKYRGGNGYVYMKRTDDGEGRFGKFSWKGTTLEVKKDKTIDFGGSIINITWVGDNGFYHKQGAAYWYYICSKGDYHCIKYSAGYGFYEMKKK